MNNEPTNERTIAQWQLRHIGGNFPVSAQKWLFIIVLRWISTYEVVCVCVCVRTLSIIYYRYVCVWKCLLFACQTNFAIQWRIPLLYSRESEYISITVVVIVVGAVVLSFCSNQILRSTELKKLYILWNKSERIIECK